MNTNHNDIQIWVDSIVPVSELVTTSENLLTTFRAGVASADTISGSKVTMITSPDTGFYVGSYSGTGVNVFFARENASIADTVNFIGGIQGFSQFFIDIATEGRFLFYYEDDASFGLYQIVNNSFGGAFDSISLVMMIATGTTGPTTGPASVYVLDSTTDIMAALAQTDGVYGPAFADEQTIRYDEARTQQRLDINKALPIVFNQKTQDFRDIEKVFTNRVYPFEIPWSKANARIFRDFQRFDADDAFDARTYLECRIEVNSKPFDRGVLELKKVVYKNGEPSAAKVAYIGRLARITEQLGDDTLSDLFTNWNFVRTGAILGNALRGNGVIALSSQFNVPTFADPDSLQYTINASGKRLIYDTSATVAENEAYDSLEPSVRNLYEGTDADPLVADPFSGLDHFICKPSIKNKTVIDAISENYVGIPFDTTSDDTFLTDDRWLDSLMLLHSKEADEDRAFLSHTLLFDIVDTEWLSYDQFLGVSYSNGIFQVDNPLAVEEVDFTVVITPTMGSDDLEYSLRVTDVGNLVSTGGSGALNRGSGVRTLLTNTSSGRLEFELSAEGGFNYTATIEARVNPGTNPQDGIQFRANASTVGPETIAASPSFVISQNCPDQKIIDWLRGQWRLWNNTSEYINDAADPNNNEIRVRQLDPWLEDGVEHDLTNYFDPYDFEVKRSEFYSDIQFKFEEPVTLLGTAFADVNGRNYGEEKWDGTDSEDTNVRKIHKAYTVEVPFQQFPYDVIPELELAYPYVADDGGSNVSIMPHMHYSIETALPSGVSITIQGGGPITDTYMRASKVFDLGGENEQSLLFYPEFDEYLAAIGSSNQVVHNTLFHRGYRNYTAGVFNSKARIREGKGWLPPVLVESIKANDTIIVGNNRFRINEFKKELLTGKSLGELVSYYPIDNTLALLHSATPGGTTGTAPTALITAVGGGNAPTTGTLAGAGIMLFGGNSTDPQGDDLTYVWRIISGTATLTNETTDTATIVSATAQSVNIGLIVNDGNESSLEATHTVVYSDSAQVWALAHWTGNITGITQAGVVQINPGNSAFVEVMSSHTANPNEDARNQQVTIRVSPPATGFIGTFFDSTQTISQNGTGVAADSTASDIITGVSVNATGDLSVTNTLLGNLYYLGIGPTGGFTYSSSMSSGRLINNAYPAVQFATTRMPYGGVFVDNVNAGNDQAQLPIGIIGSPVQPSSPTWSAQNAVVTIGTLAIDPTTGAVSGTPTVNNATYTSHDFVGDTDGAYTPLAPAAATVVRVVRVMVGPPPSGFWNVDAADEVVEINVPQISDQLPPFDEDALNVQVSGTLIPLLGLPAGSDASAYLETDYDSDLTQITFLFAIPAYMGSETATQNVTATWQVQGTNPDDFITPGEDFGTLSGTITLQQEGVGEPAATQATPGSILVSLSPGNTVDVNLTTNGVVNITGGSSNTVSVNPDAFNAALDGGVITFTGEDNWDGSTVTFRVRSGSTSTGTSLATIRVRELL